MLKIRRHRNGDLTILLPPDEALLLRELPGRLRALLTSPETHQRIIERLFPAAYRDRDRDEEYQELVRNDLLQRRIEGIDAFEETLRGWRVGRRKVEIQVGSEQFELWLCFVNDMRLVLATEIGIEDEAWGGEFDPEHPQVEDLVILHYLSWLEESLLRARGMPEIQPPGESRDS